MRPGPGMTLATSMGRRILIAGTGREAQLGKAGQQRVGTRAAAGMQELPGERTTLAAALPHRRRVEERPMMGWTTPSRRELTDSTHSRQPAGQGHRPGRLLAPAPALSPRLLPQRGSPGCNKRKRALGPKPRPCTAPHLDVSRSLSPLHIILTASCLLL